MDIETLPNCIVYCFEHYKENIKKVFIIHELQNDLPELISFLEGNITNKEWHISFNGLAFDAQITEFILRSKKILLDLPADQASLVIYNKAQEVIKKSQDGEFQEYAEKQIKIKQIDVFKLNHWDNMAKLSSLKWIQYTMDWANIQEMPIYHTTLIHTRDQLDTIVSYCQNDVSSTKRIMELSKGQINLRATLSKEYGINVYSASEPRIAKEIFMKFLSDSTGISTYELKKLRTNRNSITVRDIILPYTKFKTEPFQELLDNFKAVVIRPDNIKGSFKYSMKYKGIKTDFGLGGVHGALQSGIYDAKEGMIIMTSDIVSFYPNLIIRNKWAPAHLPQEEFSDKYEWFFEERKKIPKKDPKNYVFKIILNGTYGLSIDKNSFLYDPQLGMQTTINGQLTLMMLYEMLVEGIPGAMPIMQNTDGVEIMIPEEYKEKYLEICAEWEKITNLQLEHDEYSKIFLGDVNNYIAVYKNGKTKCKGRFEFEELALHKNKSALIISKAIYAYFVHDIPPEKFLLDNRNIFDYCLGVKSKGDWEFVQKQVIQKAPDKYLYYTKAQKHDHLKENGWQQSWDDDNWVRSDASNKEANTGISTEQAFAFSIGKEGAYEEKVLQKVIRYYISENGCKIVKRNKKDMRQIQLESGTWMMTEMNQYIELPWEEYAVDESYYLENIYKEIYNIAPPFKAQLQLF